MLASLGIVLFAVGYVRNSSNLILLGAIVVFVGIGWRDMVAGAIAGWKEAR